MGRASPGHMRKKELEERLGEVYQVVQALVLRRLLDAESSPDRERARRDEARCVAAVLAGLGHGRIRTLGKEDAAWALEIARQLSDGAASITKAVLASGAALPIVHLRMPSESDDE